MTTIALVDDDENILTSVSIFLEGEGYNVRTFTDGAAALTALSETPPDLAVFDIKMPRMDGMELLAKLRERSALPVIFLTSKDDERDEEAGFQMGADDYISKPFSLRLLVARIRAILRRSGLEDAAPEGSADSRLSEARASFTRGRLTMDPARHQVTWDGKPVSLTNQLMDAAYPDDVFVDDRTVDSHIKRMRRKFRQVDSSFGAIETLYGAGYSFSDG